MSAKTGLLLGILEQIIAAKGVALHVGTGAEIKRYRLDRRGAGRARGTVVEGKCLRNKVNPEGLGLRVPVCKSSP